MKKPIRRKARRKPRKTDHGLAKLRFSARDIDLWLVKNFLTWAEKRTLIDFYREQMADLMSGKLQEEFTKEEHNLYGVMGARIKFIVDHF